MLNVEEKEKFIELFCKFTKVSKRQLSKFLETNDISNLLKRPQLLTLEKTKLEKINEINELRQLMYVGLQSNKEKVSTPQSIYNHLIKFADYTDKEYMLATFLDQKNQIIKTDVINIGNHNSSIVSVKDISKKAILCDAVGVIIAHNHPSGETRPSNADVQLTKKVHGALRLIDITLIDHIILGENGYTSLKEKGLMENMKSNSLLPESKITHMGR